MTPRPVFLSYFDSPRTTLGLIVGIWLISQLVSFLFFGIVISVDTPNFIEGADLILNGSWPTTEMILYSSYSLLIAIVMFLGGQPESVVVIHLLFSLATLLSIFYLTRDVSGSTFTAFVASFLYAVWPDLQQWNFVVYTDAVFANAVVVSVATIYFAESKWQYALAGICLLFTLFIRPVGVIFFMAILVYALVEIRHRLTNKRVFILVGSVLVVLSIAVLNGVMKEFVSSFLDSYAKAEVIYPDESLGIQPPADLYRPDNSHQPLIQLTLFVVHNPFYFLKLSFVKALLYLGHMKPYFSWMHNIMIAVFLYPLYFFAAIGVNCMHGDRLKGFVISFAILMTITISLTSENWDGRFLLPLFPWIFMLAALGMKSKLRIQ